ncbi:cytochrome P450 [Stackebrandtia nassauensis]|uniref:Fatty acid alpha hydroxylase, cytochrome P450 n=1 Tax=Stackebrandtia nassauensis (strain DSM 44728 / CIP 108903 / NRRL B-16338 / NBRC 102104 / LLR-40K-21) TaxID=446470 RepID=D3PUT2_STANL|nr:cytochrome P450 [Stackebrandtia nassauensis]ADD44956.1 fatty acid alpha hydroxylase, cytochrome P450 [Stackebrandtia nassauensis DSM 44728]
MTDHTRHVHPTPTDADAIPRVSGDQTLGLLRHGYGYLSGRMRELGADAFEGRMFGSRTVFMAGHDAARLFYDDDKLKRAGAVPSLIRLTLFGKRTVHALDDSEHQHRKAMFNRITAPARVAELADLTDRLWREAIADWTRRSQVRLFRESVRVLGTAVCRWAGIPTRDRELEPHLRDLAAMVDNFGAVGFGQLRGRLARRRANRWAANYIEAVRGELLRPGEKTALHVIAHHRDGDGHLLDTRTAAEELINVLRPTVAVSWFVCFAAHASHTHPQWRHRLASSDDDTVRAFVDEVRRFYPFAPLLAAKARRDFSWRGHEFPSGRWVILDLYGTDHDPDRWRDPDAFDPHRFLESPPDAYDFVPHGGGDSQTGHRCPGEDLTAVLLTRTVRRLAEIDYHVPTQDLGYSANRFPSRIRSGFVMTNVVKPRDALTPPETR